MQLFVNKKRVPAVFWIRRRTEQEALPEIANDGKVVRKIEFGNVGENIPDDIIRERPLIKYVHQPIDIRPRLNVTFHINRYADARLKPPSLK